MTKGGSLSLRISGLLNLDGPIQHGLAVRV
jgi:hypothetical protein